MYGSYPMQRMGQQQQQPQAQPQAQPHPQQPQQPTAPSYNPMQPTYYNNPVDPSQYLALAYQSFMPQDAAANRALQSQLAAAGIQGGAAVNAGEQLQAQLAAAHDPALMQGLQFAQGLNQQQGMRNADAATQAGQMLAEALQGNYQFGLGAFNNLNQQTLSGYQGLSQGNLGNFPVQSGLGQGLMNLGMGIGQMGYNPMQQMDPYGGMLDMMGMMGYSTPFQTQSGVKALP